MTGDQIAGVASVCVIFGLAGNVITAINVIYPNENKWSKDQIFAVYVLGTILGPLVVSVFFITLLFAGIFRFLKGIGSFCSGLLQFIPPDIYNYLAKKKVREVPTPKPQLVDPFMLEATKEVETILKESM